MKKLLLTILSSTILLAGTINTQTVNELLDYKKEQYLKQYKPKDITKPRKQSYPIKKQLKKDMYETTPEYNTRVKKENQRYLKQRNKIDNNYSNKLKTYNTKVKKQNKRLQRAKDNLSKVLTKSLDNIMNHYLGKPTIKDFNSYNADDGIFVTQIVSNYLTIPVHIQIPRDTARKLYKSNQLKNIKPIVKFEYNNHNLYISEVTTVYINKDGKKQQFHTMPNTPNYKTYFRLKYNLDNVFFTWEDKRIVDKDFEKYFTEFETTRVEKERLEKERKERVKKERLEKERKERLEKEKLEKERKERLGKERKERVWKDTSTGFLWQDNTEAKTLKKDWNGAIQYCQKLIFAGYGDWYLPNTKQLKDLYKRKDYLRNIAFSDYWSSSPYSYDSSYAWSVDFKHGYSYDNHVSLKRYVRCIKSIQ